MALVLLVPLVPLARLGLRVRGPVPRALLDPTVQLVPMGRRVLPALVLPARVDPRVRRGLLVPRVLGLRGLRVLGRRVRPVLRAMTVRLDPRELTVRRAILVPRVIPVRRVIPVPRVRLEQPVLQAMTVPRVRLAQLEQPVLQAMTVPRVRLALPA